MGGGQIKDSSASSGRESLANHYFFFFFGKLMVILNTHYNPHTAHVRSSLDAFLPLAVGWMERSLHGPGSIKSQPHHTTLAIELTFIKFNGLLTIYFY